MYIMSCIKKIITNNCIPNTPRSLQIYNQKLISLCKNGYEPLHFNFEAVDSSHIEKLYKIITLDLPGECFIKFGITLHASQRMFQRGINENMLKKTLVYGKIQHEGPQKIWDPYGRKVYTYKNMVIVTNYEQNRIVTVYWKIPKWDFLEKTEKYRAQINALNSFYHCNFN